MIAPYWNKLYGRHTQRQQPEAKFHVLVARFLDMALPLDAWWTTIPTTRASRLEGAKLKAKGYKKGCPDLVIIYQGRAFWVELKSPLSVLSNAQTDQMRVLSRAGAKCAQAKTLDQLQDWLDQWSIPLRARLPGRNPPAVDAARAGGA